MTDKELELKFGELLVKHNKAFDSNLNPFDMFKLGIEYAKGETLPIHGVMLSFTEEVLEMWYELDDDADFGKWLYDRVNEA